MVLEVVSLWGGGADERQAIEGTLKKDPSPKDYYEISCAWRLGDLPDKLKLRHFLQEILVLIFSAIGWASGRFFFKVAQYFGFLNHLDIVTL